MRRIQIAILVGTFAVAGPAFADHPGCTGVPYVSRGDCESASAALAHNDKFWLADTFPELFDTTGESASFLTRAFTCEGNASDGQWYITDHRVEVLNSDWFQRR